MKLIIAILACQTGVCTLSADYVARRLGFEYKGKEMQCVLSNSVVLATPAWRKEEPNPPLSPRKADELARQYATKLFPEAKNWIREEISLRHVTDDHWVYEVAFIQTKGVRFSGPAPDFVVLVLMDGTVVNYYERGSPEKGDSKPKQGAQNDQRPSATRTKHNGAVDGQKQEQRRDTAMSKRKGE